MREPAVLRSVNVAMTDRNPEKPQIRTAVEARQGVTGHGVRYVLLYGTVGAALGFLFAYLVT